MIKIISYNIGKQSSFFFTTIWNFKYIHSLFYSNEIISSKRLVIAPWITICANAILQMRRKRVEPEREKEREKQLTRVTLHMRVWNKPGNKPEPTSSFPSSQRNSLPSPPFAKSEGPTRKMQRYGRIYKYPRRFCLRSFYERTRKPREDITRCI